MSKFGTKTKDKTVISNTTWYTLLGSLTSNMYNYTLESIKRRVTKLIKLVKDDSYRERFEKLSLIASLERIRGALIETFKIGNGISCFGR